MYCSPNRPPFFYSSTHTGIIHAVFLTGTGIALIGEGVSQQPAHGRTGPEVSVIVVVMVVMVMAATMVISVVVMPPTMVMSTAVVMAAAIMPAAMVASVGQDRRRAVQKSERQRDCTR